MKRNPAQLANHQYDLVIIGGGISGACVAWDAALRGLSVALIERGDFGQETSANSLKTVHGGLRYLQDLDIRLVRMMIRERSNYLRIAPHLVQPLPCITPTYSKLTKSKPAMSAALKLNDLAGFDRNSNLAGEQELPASRVYSAEDCRSFLPGLPTTKVTGGALWYDGQIYDTERLTLSFIISASKAGADIANYVAAIDLHRKDDEIQAVQVKDLFTDELFEIRGKMIVNAAGPWVDRILKGVERKPKPLLFNHSLAMNLITRKLIEQRAAGVPSWIEMNSKHAGNSQTSHMLFISPWRDLSIVGTFHSHFQGDPEGFTIEDIDLGDILQEVNSAYPGANLEMEDIRFVHYGFLPEKREVSGPEVKLVRRSRIIDHRDQDGIKGIISVIGVKYTTARYTAAKTVDLVFEQLARKSPACKTDSTRLHGGDLGELDEYLESAYHADSGLLSRRTIEHLVRSYGSGYSQVKKFILEYQDNSPLTLHSIPVIKAQVLYSIEEEMAVKLSDVIFRRTGIGSVGPPGESIIEKTAEIMADQLDWSKEKTTQEIEEVHSKYRRHGSIVPVTDHMENS